MLVPINITGASNKSRSLPLSAQVTRNLYPEVQDNQSTKSQFVLQSFPGYELLSEGYELVETSGVTFDGSNDYLSRGAGLTGAADGDFGTFVCRFRFADSSGTEMLFGMALFEIYRNSSASHQLQITLASTLGGGTLVLNHRTDTSYTDTDWHNLLISWDANAAVGSRLKIYIDDTPVAYTNVSASSSTTLICDYTQANLVIGAYSDFSSKFNGDMDLFWLDTTSAIDFSVESNRRKFFDDRGAPVDFGMDGSAPTGTAPIVYLSGDSSEFATNKGTGGGFTVTGSLSDATPVAFPATTDRGTFQHKETAYQVASTNLYSISSGGVRALLGSGGEITGTSRCIFSGIGDNIVITSEGKAYIYNGSTITEISDPDLETPNASAHINNQIIFDGDGGRFVTTEVGDATDIPALNYATAESNVDNLKRPYVIPGGSIVYMMGDRTIEQWWNSGTGTPPFDRIEGGMIPIGLKALHSVADNGDVMYFLGHDLRVWAVSGSSRQPISTIALSNAIEGYDTVDDAEGSYFTFQGQGFYQLTFPQENKSWCFNEQSRMWFEISSGDSGGRSIISSAINCYGKTLVADYRNGNIYTLNVNTFTENGTAINRIRDTGPLHGGLFGKPGVWLEMNRLELLCETGVGDLTQTPNVMLSWSDDGGRTFSTETWGTVNIGTAGQYQKKIEWFCMGGFYERILRFRMTEGVRWSIYDCAADLEIGI